MRKLSNELALSNCVRDRYIECYEGMYRYFSDLLRYVYGLGSKKIPTHLRQEFHNERHGGTVPNETTMDVQICPLNPSIHDDAEVPILKTSFVMSPLVIPIRPVIKW